MKDDFVSAMVLWVVFFPGLLCAFALQHITKTGWTFTISLLVMLTGSGLAFQIHQRLKKVEGKV